MQIGSTGAGGAIMLQLAEANRISKEASVAQVRAVSANVQERRTNALQTAVQARQSSADIKGKLLDVMA